MKRLLLTIAGCWIGAVPLAADTSPVVVELFTSQGCSSCPPADALMEKLAERDDVIPLSLHVDYWDYIGWKDEFADPRNADRQRAYAAEAGRRSIYTPEMVINGVTDIVGAKPMELSEAIAEHKEIKSPVVLRLERRGDTVEITAERVDDRTGPMVVQLVRYQPARESQITRGENAGRTIQYVNVTEGWQELQTWDGSEPLALTAQAPGAHPVVVLVQGANAGPILAAARLR